MSWEVETDSSIIIELLREILKVLKGPEQDEHNSIGKPETSKSEQKPREWWIRYPNPPESSCGFAHNSFVPEVWAGTKEHQVVFQNDEWIKVREIMRGDEK